MHRTRLPRRHVAPVLLAGLSLAAWLGSSADATAAPALHKPALAGGHGITVESSHMLGHRQLDAQVASAALGRAVDVRILLPKGYDNHRARRYPVLYLFHGTSGRASDWVRMGGAAKTTASLPLIVVMADAGFDGDGGGWFTNWVNGGAGGPPEWETFHVHQLIPWVDSNLRTIPRRRGRAIAGLSQGGFGALTYASRHPDMFSAVGSFSGAAEIDRDAQAIALVTPVIEATATGLDGSSDPDVMFGSRATDEINWRAHDPATLVSNLRGMAIWLWTGNGKPGPLDSSNPNPGAEAIEAGVHTLTQLFHGHLQDAGIPSHYDDYGPGTHSWPYWTRDLREFVGPLMRRFAHPSARPRKVGYRSADDRWSQWGWRVAMHRPQRAFSSLSTATRTGFRLAGTGSATVTTPRSYTPGAKFDVAESPAGVSFHETATKRGRLRIQVPLSDSATHASARVRIRKAGRAAPAPPAHRF